LSPVAAHSQLYATWNATPISNEFSLAANWTPATVPTVQGAFGPSSTTSITIGRIVNPIFGGFWLKGDAPAYSFTVTDALQFNTAGGISNDSSYAPTINVLSGGTVLFTSGASASNAIVKLGFGAWLYLNDSSSAQIISNGGSVNFTNNQSVGSIEGSGFFFLPGQLTVGGNNLSSTVSGVISGSGANSSLVKVGSGTLTLTGANTYTGGTTVSAGTLVLQGSLASPVVTQSGGVFVNEGKVTGDVANMGSFAHNGVVSGSVANAGLLSGTGTIAGNVANAGVISPGNGIGTMTIGGSHVNMAGSTYVAEVAGNGQSDLLKITGASSLGGGLLLLVGGGGGSVFSFGNKEFTILHAAGGVSGTFLSLIDPYPFLLPSLRYDANNVYVTLQIGGFAAAAQTSTQGAVGRVLDSNANTATGDFATILGTAATLQADQVLPFMTAISGQNYSSFSSSMVQGAALFMNNFANQTGGGGSPVSNRVALAEACDVACDVTPPAVWGAWGGALGGLGTIGSGANTGAVTYNVGGFAAGLDRLVAPGLRVGVTTGYTTGTQWTGGFSGTGMTDTFLAGLYGNYRAGGVYADAVLGYAYSYNQMWRQIFIPGLQQRTAQGRTGANQWYGQIEGGYRFDIGPVGAALADAYITPFARLQGYTGAQNGFTETGAQSLNLTVAGQTTNSLRSVIGAQLGGAIDLGWRDKLALQFRLGWSHEYAGTARPVTATLSGAPLAPFTTYGIAPTRDGAVVGFSANTAIADGTSAYLRYEGNISGQDSAHALTAGVRMTW
jgi:autotransporter-associated beta strand protein